MDRLKYLAAGLALLLLIAAGCDREISGNVEYDDDFANASEDCLACHSGYLDQAQGEWANSTHASGNNIDYTNRGGTDCTKCHNEEGYLSFLETGTLPDVPFASVSAIGCFTCHNPHETGTLELRQTEAVALIDGAVFDHGAANQCAACHQSRFAGSAITADQSVNSRFGPHHSNQSDMIDGTGGYEFPGEDYEFPLSPHANQVDNACVGCHMGDPRTHVGYQLGGHSFNMAVEGIDETLVGVCATSSCHGEDVEEFDFAADEDYDGDGDIEGYQTEMDGLLEELAMLLTTQGVLDDGSPFSGTIADPHLAGALYNYVYVEEDQSRGIHNFNYARSLIEASIDYVSGLPVPML
ncbi:MAG: hypothetical protein AB1483_09965 [Candidatus Zixiibacteriota bacterium]